jgi:hypothetical protein
MKIAHCFVWRFVAVAVRGRQDGRKLGQWCVSRGNAGLRRGADAETAEDVLRFDVLHEHSRD